MLYQFITIYTSELLTTMLLGVLILLCLPVHVAKTGDSFPIDHTTQLIPVISDSVFAGEQKRLAESVFSAQSNLDHFVFSHRDEFAPMQPH